MKRLSVAAALAAGLFITIAAPAAAEWPADRPIRILVGFGAGGGTDIVSRIIAPPLSELLKTKSAPAGRSPPRPSPTPTRTVTPH